MSRRLARLAAGPLLALIPLIAWTRPPTSEVDASPQRPSRSSNTATTAPGYVTLEAGGSFDADAFALPLMFRFGVSPRWEVYLAFPLIIGQEIDGRTETSFGDTLVGAKVRFFTHPDGEAAIEGFVKFPTADDGKGLGTGDTDAGFRFIASRVWGANAIDFNLGGEFAGVPQVESNDARWTTIITWTRTSHPRVHYFGELFIQFLPAADFETITTDWGVQYYVNPSLVLDGAVYFGLSDDAPDWQIQLGFTKVLGHWKGSGGRQAARSARLDRAARWPGFSPVPAP